MVEGMASISTGAPNERHYLLYRKWADCGFGMILSGAWRSRVVIRMIKA